MKKYLLLLLFSAALLFTSISSAYYTDTIKLKPKTLITANFDISNDDVPITADTSGLDDRLLPLKQGDSFDISFTADYSGDMDIYAVPKLNMIISNMASGDEISVRDGEETVVITSSTGVTEQTAGTIYSRPKAVFGRNKIKVTYTINVVKHSAQEPLLFSYDFSVAGCQRLKNETIGSKTGTEAYGVIADGSEINGFTFLTDGGDVADHNGNPLNKSYYNVALTADATNGNTASNTFSWYAANYGGSEKKISDGKNVTLVLNPNNVGRGLIIRFEVENEAGHVSSDSYIFTIGPSGLSASRISAQ